LFASPDVEHILPNLGCRGNGDYGGENRVFLFVEKYRHIPISFSKLNG